MGNGENTTLGRKTRYNLDSKYEQETELKDNGICINVNQTQPIIDVFWLSCQKEDKDKIKEKAFNELKIKNEALSKLGFNNYKDYK